jgi:hypothetical protein
MSFACSPHSVLHRPCSLTSWNPCAKHSPVQYLAVPSNQQQRQQQQRRRNRGNNDNDAVLAETNRFCNPYEGSDLFVVLRNPFDRIVSEFYYNCLKVKAWPCKKRQITNVTYMNESLQQRLQKRISISREGIRGGGGGGTSCQAPKNNINKKNSCYFDHCNHDIPQYDYVYDTTADTTDTAAAAAAAGEEQQQPPSSSPKRRPRRLVQWVLHLETLSEDFPKLLRRYGLENFVTLPEERVNAGEGDRSTTTTSQPRRLTVANLTTATIDLITQVYANDFEAFGYSKQPPS